MQHHAAISRGLQTAILRCDWLRLRSASLALLLVAGIAPGWSAESSATPAMRDPIEGLWLGTVEAPKERIRIGFEFRRDSAGKLQARFTQPILNSFAVDAGAVRREGDRVLVDDLKLALTLQGDTLTGTYPGVNAPANLHRADALPQAPDLPTVPTGAGPRWQTRLGGQVFASPVVHGHVAYVGTTGGVFNAVDTRSGAFVWAFRAGAPIYGAAAVDADAVYFADDAGVLFKLDRASGKELWRYDIGTATRVLPHPAVFDWDWQGAQPLLADGVVYIGAGDGSFHAVDATSGRRHWRFETRGKIRVGAALDGARVIVGSDDHFVYALDRATGKEVWRFDVGAEVDAAPMVHDGRVFVGNRGEGLRALTASSGKELWKQFFWGSWVESTPVVRDGLLYIGSSDLRRVSCVDPKDGRVLWRTDVHGWTWGTPLLTADRIYVGAAGGTPYFIKHVASFTTLDRSTGAIISRWPLPDAGGHEWGIAGSPVHSGDTVVVATIEGALLGFPM